MWSFVNNKFSGLRSLWTIPNECMYSKPFINWKKK